MHEGRQFEALHDLLYKGSVPDTATSGHEPEVPMSGGFDAGADRTIYVEVPDDDDGGGSADVINLQAWMAAAAGAMGGVDA